MPETMNKNRILKLETKVEGELDRAKGIPHVWRPEEGKLAIVATSFIIDRLKSLNREIVYSPYIFKAVYVDREDRDIVDRIEGNNLYLKGLKNPIWGMPEIIWVKTGKNE
jgi:hypothetical protein